MCVIFIDGLIVRCVQVNSMNCERKSINPSFFIGNMIRFAKHLAAGNLTLWTH